MNPSALRFTRLALAFCGAGLLAACSVPKRIADDGLTVRDQTAAMKSVTRQDALPVDALTRGTAASADSRAALLRDLPVARRASRAWIGARMTAVQSDEVLPAVFNESFKLNFDDRSTGGRVSIAVIAERLSRLTNVPVRIKQDVYQGRNGSAPSLMPATSAPILSAAPLPAGTPVGGKSPTTPLPPGATLPLGAGATASLPAGLPMTNELAATPAFREVSTEVNSVDMRWEGSLASFLDHVTGRLNLSWSYRDGVVVIERFITESFETAAFTGSQDFKMSLSGSNSGQSVSGNGNSNGGSATSSLDVNETGKISALESLRKSVEAMVSPVGGSVVINEGSGRFTVTATKDVMGRVRQVLKHESETMSRQAQIQFDIYSVTMDDADERGVDWNVVFQNLSKTWGAVLKSPATLAGSLGGAMSYSILAPAAGMSPANNTQARFGNSSAMLTLLSEISDTAQYKPLSMLALNRQWARTTNLKTDGYLSETTPAVASSVSGGGSPGLKTSSIVTGDKILVQPAILDNGEILLKFGISLTELLGLFNVTAGEGETFQQVQTPVTSGTDNQATVRLMPGEAMVVTGLSRRLSSGDVRKLADGLPLFAGGSRKLGYKREEFVIVVRAVQI